jgi:hypothetical protein
MNRSFLSKVSAERKVLSIVNRYTPGRKQLAGLSATAIEAWHRGAERPAMEAVVRELRALSDSCQRLSDRSHETFQPLAPGLEDVIESGLSLLTNELRIAFSK